MPKAAYIELLKKVLIDAESINKFEYYPLEIVKANWKTYPLYLVNYFLKLRNFTLCKIKFIEKDVRLNGYDWPSRAKTMIGLKRLDNIEDCIEKILEDNIEGDFIETGVWRGGATILMKAILNDLKIFDRKVWLVDSFEGLPKPDPKYTEDNKNKLYRHNILKVSLDEVKNNFEYFDLLDENVIFVKGWFRDTLPNIEIKKISLLRLDGDLYESTILSLNYLYPKLSQGGFVIIDDYNAFDYCKKAVDDFRVKFNINETIVSIDNEAIFWRKNS